MKNNNAGQNDRNTWISEDIKIEVGKKLLNLRKELGLKQDEVAKAVGITRASLSYYEKGERSIDIEVLYRLSEFFNISIDYLFGLSDKVPPQREHSENYEMNKLGFSYQTLDEFWGNSIFVDMIDAFVAHKDFEIFKELACINKYSDYKFYAKSYKSFLLSQLLYTMISDIIDDWYKNYNDEIATLPVQTLNSLHAEIEEFIKYKDSEKRLYENGEISLELYLEGVDDKISTLNRIYNKIDKLLKQNPPAE